MLIFEYVFINIVRVQTQCSLIGIAKKITLMNKKIVIMKMISKGRKVAEISHPNMAADLF